MRIDGYCTLGVDREFHLTEEALLNAMDAARIDMAVIAPVPRFMAVRNREGNDFILTAARAHPDRFIPACAANPWLAEEAVAELKRASGDGARMLVLDPAVQGFGLGDDLSHALVEAAAELRLPVYVHTGGYQFGAPAQLGLAAERFPRTNFIMGHSGSTDFKIDALEVAQLFPNVYPEASFARAPTAAGLLEALGDDRVIMGTAAPLNDLVFEWSEAAKCLPPADHPGFYGQTLHALLSGGNP